jgi:hypothetical protein
MYLFAVGVSVGSLKRRKCAAGAIRGSGLGTTLVTHVSKVEHEESQDAKGESRELTTVIVLFDIRVGLIQVRAEIKLVI